MARTGSTQDFREAPPIASETVDEMAEAAASLGKDVREAATAAGQAIKEQATVLAGDVGEELGKTADRQKDRGAEAMRGFARAIHSAAGDLDQHSPQVAQYFRDSASKVEALSDNIGKRDISELMQAATDLARSQPGVFFGGAVAAGFVLSRFLKSTAHGTEAQGSRKASRNEPRD